MKNPQSASDVLVDLRSVATVSRAESSSWYFKTGKGQYGEGDVFIGVTVPMQRKIASTYHALSYSELAKLLNSKLHECRLVALFILVRRYKLGDEKVRMTVYKFYLSLIDRVNNWDLVDCSAPSIVGAYMMTHPEKKQLLYTFIKSRNMWKRRIAILSTFMFIKYDDYAESLAIAKLLLGDSEDLIQKATGWMLREIGKKNIKEEEKFLTRYHKVMPRTMLRYAIEKFSSVKRQRYLAK